MQRGGTRHSRPHLWLRYAFVGLVAVTLQVLLLKRASLARRQVVEEAARRETLESLAVTSNLLRDTVATLNAKNEDLLVTSNQQDAVSEYTTLLERLSELEVRAESVAAPSDMEHLQNALLSSIEALQDSASSARQYVRSSDPQWRVQANASAGLANEAQARFCEAWQAECNEHGGR